MLEPFGKIEPLVGNKKPHRRTVGDLVERIKKENVRLARTSSQAQDLQVAEEFLKSLPELSYHVTKINQWGKHQTRIVRLTSEGIENIRMNVVSSMHAYGEVQTVALRNLNTFFIHYLHADHDYVYRSPIAVQIVHEISTRVALRRSTNKKKFSMERALERFKANASPRRSLRTTERPISLPSLPIPTTTTSTTSTSISHAKVSSAPAPENSFLSISAVLSNSPAGGRSSLPISSSSPAPSLSSSPSPSPDEAKKRAERKERQREKRAAKLSKVLGTSQDTRLHAEVDRFLWNETTPEGKTVTQFITEFYVLMKNPATCLANVRSFLDTMRSNIIATRGDMLIKLVVNASSEQAGEEAMSLIIEKCLEQAVIGRLHKQIFATISATCKISDEHLMTVIAQLKGRSQRFFGVPEKLESISGWSTTQAELLQIAQSDTPGAKLTVIVSAAKSIFSTADYEQTVLNKRAFVLSADDFLPIFMYAIVHSELTGLESTNQYLWQLCDPSQLMGEGGYYLTVFSSIVGLLHRISLSSLSHAVSMDDVVLEDGGGEEEREEVHGDKKGWRFWK